MSMSKKEKKELEEYQRALAEEELQAFPLSEEQIEELKKKGIIYQPTTD